MARLNARWLGAYVRPGAGRCSLIGHGPGAVEGIEDETVKGLVALNAAIIFPVIELEWILWNGFNGAGYALEPALRLW